MALPSPFAIPTILTIRDEEDSLSSSGGGTSSVGLGTSTKNTPMASPAASTSRLMVDEDSRGSSSGVSAAKKKRISTSEAEKIIEYQWPEQSGHYWMLQEQICDFLGIKSFKRKYPDFYRRQCDVEERRFLKDYYYHDQPVLELGMTALKSDDVMELMAKEYPEKYCEYLAVLESRHQDQYTHVSKGYTTVNIEKSKMGDFIKKAIESVTEYNQIINQERRDERKVCMDLQTYTTHYPIGLGKENKQLARNIKKGKVPSLPKASKHPIALVPGQYQDWYIKYSPEEMKYLPLGTVIYGPVVTDPSKLPPILSSADEDVDSDSESGSECSGSCSSSSGESGSDSDSNDGSFEGQSSTTPGPPPAPLLMCDDKLKSRPNAICRLCHKTSNKDGVYEMLVHCADCENSSHPSCLDMTQEMVDVVKTYPWQCTDCKTCVTCFKSTEEENMMFCDKCDRGYHNFCVGLESIPSGKWVCRLCAQCAVCGTTQPSIKEEPTPSTSKSKRESARKSSTAVVTASNADSWHHETIAIISPSGETLKRHNLLCQQCYQDRRKH